MAKKKAKEKTKAIQKWSNKSKWQNEFILKVYELLKHGMIERNAAKALGISFPTFCDWESKKPLFAMAVQAGRAAYRDKDNSNFSFQKYVAGRLSEEGKEVWEKINRCDTLKNGTERLEAILSCRGVRVRQSLFMHAFISTNFSISAALRRVNLNRGTFELWKKDPEFLRLFEELSEIKKDFFDEHLCMLVAGGDSAATIFGVRTLCQDRYPDPKANVNLNVQGNITQTNINVVMLLDSLSVEAKKELLEKHRQLQLQEAS